MGQREATVIECFVCGGWHESAGSFMGFANLLPCPKAPRDQLGIALGEGMPVPRRMVVTVNVDGGRSGTSPPEED